MTTSTITDEKRLTTLKHLAGGKGLDVVATIVGLPRETVLDIGSKHGYPDTDKLAWAADVVEGKIRDTATDLPAGRPTPRTPQTAGAAASPAAAPAPAPGLGALTKPDEIRVLLNTAKSHPSKRIQAAADKAFDQLDRIRTLIREDDEKHAAARKAAADKAAARAEVERLEAQLAAAKAKLRGNTPAKPTTSSAVDGPSAAEIRAWAADAGIDCPAVGRVPNAVRDAYNDAHQDAA